MKIVISNLEFDYNTGVRLLKLKYEDCPFKELEDVWEDVIPLSFKEIAEFKNLEHRRIGILCLGIDRLIKEVKPTLLNKKTIKKQTTWVDKDGSLKTKKFNDTYELYKVDGKQFSNGVQERWQSMADAYYVKCKDTSTDREYLIWVDLQNVYRTNNPGKWDFNESKVNAIQAVAWTIQTDVPVGNIEKIVRQGDCVLIKVEDKKFTGGSVRHLTEKEYCELLVAES
jgi:hypothetical protein